MLIYPTPKLHYMRENLVTQQVLIKDVFARGGIGQDFETIHWDRSIVICTLVFLVFLWNAFENYCVSKVFIKVIAICLNSIAQLYC